MPKRCALGCPPLGVPVHIFPHPEKFPETFKAWVEIVGGKLETPDDYVFYRQKRICDIHFTEKDKNRNHRLNALAVPTLCMPDETVKIIPASYSDDGHQRPPLTAIENLTDKMLKIIPASHSNDGHQPPPLASIENLTGNAVKIIPASHSEYGHQRPPLTSLENLTDCPVNIATTPSNFTQSSKIMGNLTDCPEKNVETLLFDITQPSTSKKNLWNEFQKETNLLTLASEENVTVESSAFVLQEHNYSKQKYSKAKGWPTLQATKIRGSPKINQSEINRLKRKINRLTLKNKNFKSRLENAEKLNNDVAFRRVTRNMTSSARQFTKMQFTETKKKPSGRRFTLEQKILSLSLYKRGAKVYSLLSKLFTLPSTKTLRSLLSKVKLGSGLIDVIFDKLKDTVQTMNMDDKLCTLMFDEMALTPQIHYDRANDKLKGFTDFENKKIADHVLVFMIKGVKANYKQPVAYYFTNSINKFQLKILIKKVIHKLQATGLIVMCTVCDQGTANVGAINELVQDSKNEFLKKGKAWRHDFFQVNNKEIIPLFDVPHLIKGLRNNLLTKDLLYIDFKDSDKQKIVKWKYFQEVYEADKCLGEVKGLHKLTEEHIIPEKIKKMRVKNAAQIFSHSVAVVTDHLVARKLVREECRLLVPIVILIDNLFDSLNSSTIHIPDGKMYKGCVRRTSPHHGVWQNAIKTLKSMKFITKKKSNGNKIQLIESVAPTIKNFIKTIEGMQVLWRVLSINYQFDCMLTRHFNQDPLENFFGNIRSYGVRNVSPNCIAFEGAYKSLLLNNFNSTHSLQANCEKDSYNCLQNLKFFLKENIFSDVSKEVENIIISEDLLEVEPRTESDVGQGNYVCGWVLMKCLKTVIKGCKICKKDLLSNMDRESTQYIKAKEYNKNKKWLVYPSKACEDAFREIQQITVCILKKDVPTNNLKKKIKVIVDTLVYFPCTCQKHFINVRENFENTSINVLIYSWCRSINRILSGKLTYDGEDELKNIAQTYYKKHQHNKTKK